MKKTIKVQENGMEKEIQYDTSVESYENSPMVNMLAQFHSEKQPIVLSESLMALL
ncbi:hypothetical protein [Paenibacillus illinoisensis]|uniref:hypothetical protein n=1 Tax=Paenibacillus illinoisensis TaxID=59845 RepID=UPI0030166D6B